MDGFIYADESDWKDLRDWMQRGFRDGLFRGAIPFPPSSHLWKTTSLPGSAFRRTGQRDFWTEYHVPAHQPDPPFPDWFEAPATGEPRIGVEAPADGTLSNPFEGDGTGEALPDADEMDDFVERSFPATKGPKDGELEDGLDVEIQKVAVIRVAGTYGKRLNDYVHRVLRHAHSFKTPSYVKYESWNFDYTWQPDEFLALLDNPNLKKHMFVYGCLSERFEDSAVSDAIAALKTAVLQAIAGGAAVIRTIGSN